MKNPHNLLELLLSHPFIKQLYIVVAIQPSECLHFFFSQTTARLIWLLGQRDCPYPHIAKNLTLYTQDIRQNLHKVRKCTKKFSFQVKIMHKIQ